jgi:DNA mismatch repair ATPase MutS
VFEQFSQHATAWRQAIGCICLLDSLLSLATYSNSLEQGVFPQLEESAVGHLDIQEGRHPCLDLAGEALIPNDTQLSREKSLIILTGAAPWICVLIPYFA